VSGRPIGAHGTCRGLVVRALLLVLVVSGLSTVAPALLGAQSTSGALFLLLPTGGRSVGLGQAVVADTLGSEAIWWNPAALARLTTTEIGVQGSRNVGQIYTGSAITWARPSARLGTIAFGVNLLDAGATPLTNDQGLELGEIALRNWILAASYATTFAKRFDAGLTYKFVQTRFDCSGLCSGVAVYQSSTSVVDVGGRAQLSGKIPVSLGASVRNIGPRFQINDREQADPMPTALQVGVTVEEIPAIRRRSPELSLRTSTDLFYDIRGGDGAISLRAGTELGWRGRVFVRGGWMVQANGGGPSIGIGAKIERLIFDVGTRFDGLSVTTGQAPTFVTLRFGF
jgi:hypothetical protein